MSTHHDDELDIAYALDGPEDGAPVLLITGLSLQLTAWPAALVDALSGAGFRVVRMDNRDAGLSRRGVSRAPHLGMHVLKRRFGWPSALDYTLDDLAADASTLMERLGHERFHLVGLSMGGMISQILAAEEPGRVVSLTLLMTSTGNPALPGPSPAARKVLGTRPPREREAAVRHGMDVWRTLGTSEAEGGPTDEALRAFVEATLDRSADQSGTPRQLAAIIEAGDLRRYGRKVSAPTLVIHGEADPLIPPAAGRDLERTIPGARLEAIEGMGHDLPPGKLDRVTRLMLDHMSAA